jgi:hypothetical protein
MFVIIISATGVGIGSNPTPCALTVVLLLLPESFLPRHLFEKLKFETKEK